MKLTALPFILLVILSGLNPSPADPLPGLYLTNAVVLSNGSGQFEIHTPDTNQPYLLLRSWAKDFCIGQPRWEVENHLGVNPLDSPTNRYLVTLPVRMSEFGTIFWRAAPLGQPMHHLKLSMSSLGTLDDAGAVVSWPTQPYKWQANLRVANCTNFPAATNVLLTGPPGTFTTVSAEAGDASLYKQNYYWQSYNLPGDLPSPPAGTWQIDYDGEVLEYTVPDPQVSSRYVAMVPHLVISNGILTSVSWTYRDLATGTDLALPAHIAGSESVTVSVISGGGYDSPPHDRWRTNYIFGTLTDDLPPLWTNVWSLNMGFSDVLGNEYSFSYHK